MYKKLLAITFIAIIFIYSCTKDKGALPPPVVVADTCTSNIKFSTQVTAIINTKCAVSGCHLPSGYKDFTTYVNIMGNTSPATIKIRINSTSSNVMPPSYSSYTLSACEISKLGAWVDAGAPNN